MTINSCLQLPLKSSCCHQMTGPLWAGLCQTTSTYDDKAWTLATWPAFFAASRLSGGWFHDETHAWWHPVAGEKHHRDFTITGISPTGFNHHREHETGFHHAIWPISNRAMFSMLGQFGKVMFTNWQAFGGHGRNRHIKAEAGENHGTLRNHRQTICASPRRWSQYSKPFGFDICVLFQRRANQQDSWFCVTSKNVYRDFWEVPRNTSMSSGCCVAMVFFHTKRDGFFRQFERMPCRPSVQVMNQLLGGLVAINDLFSH